MNPLTVLEVVIRNEEGIDRNAGPEPQDADANMSDEDTHNTMFDSDVLP